MKGMHLLQKVLIAIGAVAVLVGALWMGQGAGYIPGSFMTGDRTWLGIGLVSACVGLTLIYIGLQRPRPRWAQPLRDRGPKKPPASGTTDEAGSGS